MQPVGRRSDSLCFVATMDTAGRRDSVDEEEAVEIATDYLDEIGWFNGDPVAPDHVARV